MGWQERVEYEQAQRQQVEEELLRVRQQLAAAIETKVASSPLLSSPLAFVSLTSFPSALHLFSSARVVLATSSPHSQLLLTSPPHHILSTSTLPPPPHHPLFLTPFPYPISPTPLPQPLSSPPFPTHILPPIPP